MSEFEKNTLRRVEMEKRKKKRQIEAQEINNYAIQEKLDKKEPFWSLIDLICKNNTREAFEASQTVIPDIKGAAYTEDESEGDEMADQADNLMEGKRYTKEEYEHAKLVLETQKPRYTVRRESIAALK